jgi:hypothetical protein
VWSQEAKLVGTGALGPFLADQGFSVSLSGDGKTAIESGPIDNGGIGATWVFARPVFAGTPGKANCHEKSASALVRQYHGLNAAAAALGFSSVRALQNAILAFCEDCLGPVHGDDCDEPTTPGIVKDAGDGGDHDTKNANRSRLRAPL